MSVDCGGMTPLWLHDGKHPPPSKSARRLHSGVMPPHSISPLRCGRELVVHLQSIHLETVEGLYLGRVGRALEPRGGTCPRFGFTLPIVDPARRPSGAAKAVSSHRSP